MATGPRPGQERLQSVGVRGASGCAFPPSINAEMQALLQFAAAHHQHEVLGELQRIGEELGKQSPEQSVIHKAWAAVQGLATLDGAHSLLSKATVALFSYVQGLG